MIPSDLHLGTESTAEHREGRVFGVCCTVTSSLPAFLRIYLQFVSVAPCGCFCGLLDFLLCHPKHSCREYKQLNGGNYVILCTSGVIWCFCLESRYSSGASVISYSQTIVAGSCRNWNRQMDGSAHHYCRLYMLVDADSSVLSMWIYQFTILGIENRV